MNGYTLTRVWQVDHKLVVAKTIEEAIALFKTYTGENYKDGPKHIKAVSIDSVLPDYNAIIKEN